MFSGAQKLGEFCFPWAWYSIVYICNPSYWAELGWQVKGQSEQIRETLSQNKNEKRTEDTVQ